MTLRCVISALIIVAFASLSPVSAAKFSIDPDPSSPTLGEMLDQEARPRPSSAAARVPALSPSAPKPRLSGHSEPLPPARSIVRDPYLPPNRSTVIAPRAVHRPIAAQPAVPYTQTLPPELAGKPPSLFVEPLPKASAASAPEMPRAVRQIDLAPLKPVGGNRSPVVLRDPVITHSSASQPAPAAEPRALSKLEEPARGLPVRANSKVPEMPSAKPAQPENKVLPAPTVPSKPVSEINFPPSSKAEPANRAPSDPVQRADEPKAAADSERIVYVIDQDLRQFLTDFARRVGMRSDIAANVRGRLTKVKLPTEPAALLRELERRFDFEWLIEGEILKVSSRSDLATRILPLGSLTLDDLIREMKAVDIDVTRYPLRKLNDSNAVITTAPATYIGRVAALIDVLKAGKTVGPDLRIVRNGSSRKVEWD